MNPHQSPVPDPGDADNSRAASVTPRRFRAQIRFCPSVTQADRSRLETEAATDAGEVTRTICRVTAELFKTVYLL